MSHPNAVTISVSDDMLRSFFQRWQRLEEEKQTISDDLKELFAEAKGQGFDGRALRVAFRRVSKIDDAAEQEHETIIDLYVSSILGTQVATRTRAAREPEIYPGPQSQAAVDGQPSSCKRAHAESEAA